MRFRQIVALLALVAAAPAVAQQALVQGEVQDHGGGAVVGARLSFEPQAGRGVRATVKTNKKGAFLVGILRPGSYRVLVESEGLVAEEIRASAVGPDRRVAWEKEEAVGAEGFELEAEDGQRITLDFVMGESVAVVTAAGDRESMSATEALAALAAKVQAGDCDSALPEIGGVVAAAPADPLAHYLHGFCLAGAGRDEQALAAVTRALELDPGFPGAALLRGQVLGREGRVDEARAMVRQEIERDADPGLTVDAWIALGLLHEQAGDGAAAIEAFEKVRELAPDRIEAYLELAALYTAAERPDDAERILEASQNVGGASAAALLNVAIAHYNRRECAEATRLIERCLGMEIDAPDRAVAHSVLGRCQLQGGDAEEALASLLAAQQADPESQFAAENRQLIEALRK